jgi:serine/threonine protein kinase
VKIADFGMATTIRQTPAGSLPFNTAEKLLGYSTGPADDIWAYACTIFELFTRSPAFDVIKCESADLRDHIHLRSLEIFTGEMLSRQFLDSGDPEKRHRVLETRILYHEWEKTNSTTLHSLQVLEQFYARLILFRKSLVTL